VLVVVAGVLGVPVPVVQIVHVVVMLDAFVAAAGTVDMLVFGLIMLPVVLGRTHLASAFRRSGLCRGCGAAPCDRTAARGFNPSGTTAI